MGGPGGEGKRRGDSRDKTRARANTQTQRQRHIGEAPSRASGTARGLMPQSTLSSKLQTSSSTASSYLSTHSPCPVLPYYLPQRPLPSPLLRHLEPRHSSGLIPHSNRSSTQPPPSNTSCSPIRGRHPHPPLNHCSRILVPSFLAPRPVLALPKGTF